MIEAFLNNPYGIIGVVLLACFSAYLAWRNGHKTRLASAATTFRSAIDPTVFSGLRGHPLHGALIKHFPAHLAATHEFRRYLGFIDRWRFRKAWRAYHGGSEENPDWFTHYCLPNDGPLLLVHRLETLRNAANQT